MPGRRTAPKSDTPSLFASDSGEGGAAPAHFPDDWVPALAGEFGQPYFAKLQAFVDQDRTTETVFPAAEQTYAALRLTPPDAVRVVVLGQDPYPTPGHAHGLAFSVEPGVSPPASLRNIYKELHSDLGIPPAEHGDLRTWAERGVLLLNSVLTVRSGAAGSHGKKGWETFTDAILRAVNGFDRPVVFVLWGNYAIKKRPLIDEGRHAVVQMAHPSPLSASKGFFGSKPFSQVNAALEKLGRPPIDWRLPAEPA